MAKNISKDPRPSETFRRYHLRARGFHTPWTTRALVKLGLKKKSSRQQLFDNVQAAASVAKDLLPVLASEKKDHSMLAVQLTTAAMVAPVLMTLSRVRYRGLENIPQQGFVLCGNHVSYFDPLLVALPMVISRRQLAAMGKSDLFKGVSGSVLSRMGAFPVRRGIWDQEALGTAAQVIEQKKILMMFPEGRISSDPKQMFPAKQGVGQIALEQGSTIVPVFIDGARGLYKPWRFKKVIVTFGKPIVIEAKPEHTREDNLYVSRQVLTEIVAMSGGKTALHPDDVDAMMNHRQDHQE